MRANLTAKAPSWCSASIIATLAPNSGNCDPGPEFARVECAAHERKRNALARGGGGGRELLLDARRGAAVRCRRRRVQPGDARDVRARRFPLHLSERRA